MLLKKDKTKACEGEISPHVLRLLLLFGEGHSYHLKNRTHAHTHLNTHTHTSGSVPNSGVLMENSTSGGERTDITRIISHKYKKGASRRPNGALISSVLEVNIICSLSILLSHHQWYSKQNEALRRHYPREENKAPAGRKKTWGEKRHVKHLNTF